MWQDKCTLREMKFLHFIQTDKTSTQIDFPELHVQNVTPRATTKKLIQINTLEKHCKSKWNYKIFSNNPQENKEDKREKKKQRDKHTNKHRQIKWQT